MLHQILDKLLRVPLVPATPYTFAMNMPSSISQETLGRHDKHHVCCVDKDAADMTVRRAFSLSSYYKTFPRALCVDLLARVHASCQQSAHARELAGNAMCYAGCNAGHVCQRMKPALALFVWHIAFHQQAS